MNFPAAVRLVAEVIFPKLIPLPKYMVNVINNRIARPASVPNTFPSVLNLIE